MMNENGNSPLIIPQNKGLEMDITALSASNLLLKTKNLDVSVSELEITNGGALSFGITI